MYKEGYNPSAAGQSLATRCAFWRKSLLAALPKTDYTVEAQIEARVHDVRKIQQMDAKELFAAYQAIAK